MKYNKEEVIKEITTNPDYTTNVDEIIELYGSLEEYFKDKKNLDSWISWFNGDDPYEY